MEIHLLYKLYQQHPSVQTDTRRLKKGDLFFALKGEHFNGNQFALQALEQGAAFAIIDEALDNTDSRLIKVDDVLITLQQLAHDKHSTSLHAASLALSTMPLIPSAVFSSNFFKNELSFFLLRE